MTTLATEPDTQAMTVQSVMVETQIAHPGMTVRDVLVVMNYTFPHVVISVNGKIVPYDAYDTTEVPDQADVRVIHLTAGG